MISDSDEISLDTDSSSDSAARVLIVDDEKVIREILSEFLSMEGYVVRSVEDGEKAITELRLRPYDMVISDLKMPRVSGIELLQKIGEEELDVLTVIMTGFGTVETAIEAMKRGAYDYILKPFKVEEVMHVVQRGLERQALQTENIRLRETLTIYKVSEAIATSLDLDHVLNVILHAAQNESSADIATLHLLDPKTGRYEERVRMGESQLKHAPPAPSIETVMPLLSSASPILAHGIKANRFFDSPVPGEKLVSYAAVPLQIAGRVIGMLNVFSYRRGKKFDEGHRKMLSVLASRAASAIENARLYDDLIVKNEALETANRTLEENFEQTVAGFAQALEESDRYTRGHSERVAFYAELIAVALTLDESEVSRILRAGIMHDVGKIGVRYDMLNKPGPLTPDEMAIFREHPEKGKRILEPVPCMHGLIDGCWCHHERWDGGGYPRGLKGQNIPLAGRIVSIADAYDAMTSDRAYRKALPHAVAVAEIERCAGSQFDPELAKVFLAHIDAFRERSRAQGHLHLAPV